MKNEAALKYFICNHSLLPVPGTDIFEKLPNTAVYEVLKLVNGTPLFFEDHLERMRGSARSAGIVMEKDNREILEEITLLSEKNNCRAINVKLVLSGPSAGPEIGPDTESDIGSDAKPVFLTYFIHAEYPDAGAYDTGIHTILFSGVRHDPHVKTLAGSFRDQVARARSDHHAFEALLLNTKGYITEGSRSNLFYIKDGRVCTPPLESVLPGVTRRQVLEICAAAGIDVIERALHENELADIEGCFLTGTTVDVLPVGSVDKHLIPSVSNPVIRRIVADYAARVDKYIAGKDGPCI